VTAQESEARPVPTIDDLTRAFWTSGADGKLVITRCSTCARLFHPPGPICPNCYARTVESAEVSGLARVDAFTIVCRPWISGYDTPYVVARVRLVEQPDVVLVTNVVNCEPNLVRVGMDVAVVFEQRGDVHVPMFEPAPQ
jgi:uncharacterized OB-fold protein